MYKTKKNIKEFFLVINILFLLHKKVRKFSTFYYDDRENKFYC